MKPEKRNLIFDTNFFNKNIYRKNSYLTKGSLTIRHITEDTSSRNSGCPIQTYLETLIQCLATAFCKKHNPIQQRSKMGVDVKNNHKKS